MRGTFGSYFVTADVVVGEGVPGGEVGLPEEFVTWLDGVCAAMGATVVPDDPLREPYEGPSVPEAHRDEERVAIELA
ncbi:hypothetical protein ABZY16_26915 [Streptomyces sp. NPDC006553]|uniref:hypothetical protein n=1 Tax=Streptomyces sp. NPDC006553 TaxID=3157180 RepID=UPI0033BE7265